MRPIIKVENLSKQYRIGARQASFPTLRDSIAETLRSPFGWLRRNGNHQDNTIWALKDVSFEVKPGEVVGVIGRNGAGKSTLLKILSRITEPTTGQVDLYGRVASLLEVGTGFHVELSGRENIYLNGAILGMKRIEIDRKFDEIVAFAEIDKFIDTPVKHYSSGMYMRLAFAIAAHLDPEILVLDEVLAVGDMAFQKKCLGKMGNVAKEGRTVLFVSHNLEAVLGLCDKGVYLEKGCVLSFGSIKDVSNQYLNAGKYREEKEMILSNRTRPSFVVGSGFCIKGLKLLGSSGKFSYKIGEFIQIEITYQHASVIDGLRLGLGINTVLGQRICTFHSDLNSEIIKVGENRVYLTIDTSQLKPGDYMLDVGARSGKIIYDALSDVLSFEILPVTVTGSVHDDDNFGLISIKHYFSLEPGHEGLL